MNDFAEDAEQREMFRRKNDGSASILNIFRTNGSAGNNNEKLARILAAFDTFIKTMKWEKKPLAKFSETIAQYQASVNGKYHNDYKDILIAEEIERRRAERKDISILQS